MRSHFSRFGDVTDAVVMRDSVSNRSRGFGFIVYADESAVEAVLAQQHILDDRRVDAKRAVPKADNGVERGMGGSGMRSNNFKSGGSQRDHFNKFPAGKTKKIFVGGLHYETTHAGLHTYFEQFGRVDSAEVLN